MRLLIATLLVISLASPALACEIIVATDRPTAQVRAAFGPQTKAFIADQGAEIVRGRPVDLTRLRDQVTAANLGTKTSRDIDAVIATVMMQVGQETADDLREELDAIKAAQKKRPAIRAGRAPAPVLGRLEIRPPIYRLNYPDRLSLRDQMTRLKAEIDSLGEISALDQMHMQAELDRMKKAIETLSNLMKKTSDITAAISGNLK